MRINKTRNVRVGTPTTRKRVVKVEQTFLAIILSVVHFPNQDYWVSKSLSRISLRDRNL